MSSRLIKIFEDEKLIKRIKTHLPYLFQIAELESSRAGKIGMEVGSLREKIIVALLIQINWNNTGGFYYIPLEDQKGLFDRIGKERYIKLPKQGTNSRGVEITKEALSSLVEDALSKTIKIHWQRTKIDYNPYKRWVDYWRED
ncbi:MAG: ThaI family type II restriction endonuclease [Candidatus Cloacimonetes bacterium]|nr:ThaI family type II restriction endonuclease [Candidatus Cloacimonadota bacterium]MBL7085785.1 ThaI family type II restriction endonuclease [Candidatus Cloacimonadota bacterium]